MSVKNRIVMAPMERNYANRDGTVSERTLAHYASVAQGGVGWIDVESTFIHPAGRGRTHQLGLHDDRCIPGFQKLVEEAHRRDVRIGIELHHAGRNTCRAISGYQPVAPSPVPCPEAGNDMPHELTVDEIEAIIGFYAAAARRAATAGFDAVELHSAHGYLPLAFLSPATNLRTDEYGGPVENRMRFGVEVLAAMKAAVGASLTVGCRLSATDFVSGGLVLADTVAYARGLQAAGADYIHVSAGVYASFQYIIPSMDFPPGWLVPMASEVKSSLSIPVIAVSRINDPRLADEIIARGEADLVAFGRAFLADPQFPNKAREGRLEDIVTCIGVNQGCGGRVANQLDATCVVNPTTGRELTFGLEPAARQKRVLVVGGGPAGMEAARVAAERGHHVTLCEQSDQLGGQARLAGELPHRTDWQLYLRDARHRLDKAGVEVLLGTPVTEDWIREKSPDVIVFATGSRIHWREVPGAPPDFLSDVQTVMNAGTSAAKTVLVVGANRIGLGFAEWVAERGASVTLVEPSTSVGGDVEGGTLPVLMERVRNSPRINIFVDRDVREVNAEGVVIGQTGVIGPLFVQTIPNIEIIVFADDRRSENYLAQLARAHGLAGEIYEIGDCETPRSSLEAIYDGASVGRRL
jgi:2,4-dienoyl-CoA reductase-like NADH-dependent reductase (Old Yellow Enzyme family)/ribulose 1,5-bisphosphate synthetase/thiazole synthase